MTHKLTGATPDGPTQHRWYAEGYQAALRDILQAREESGLDGVNEWLRNNLLPASEGPK